MDAQLRWYREFGDADEKVTSNSREKRTSEIGVDISGATAA